MSNFPTESEAISYIFRSMRRMGGAPHGPDELTRDVTPTRHLLAATGLPAQPRQYAVVTGSKGKGSTTFMTARLLQALGHRVGMMSSPHLVSWRERIRVDGQAIPEVDFLRILGELTPEIDRIEAGLSGNRYFSPQGLFLGVALRWFDEQDVTAAVLEVGRGGRFDDISVVPNQLSLFTPIMLEHPEQLGPTVERIAWHKSGIIKPYSHAYSVPQMPSVLEIIGAEAETQHASFSWVADKDMGEYLGAVPGGQRIQLGRYGELTLSLLGRYQIMNASLAVIGAGNMHGRLGGVPHGSDEYINRIRKGLGDLRWPGRCQQIDDHPLVFVDGAINDESARLLVESVREQLRPPVVSILSVPADKDYPGVYAALGAVSQHIILTETTRNPGLRFPAATEALALAGQYAPDVRYQPTIAPAVDAARQLAGQDGTILIVGTQSIVAESLGLWGLSFEQL
jgi:dihydrofolate synthase/folylpolyglutamate synthase